MLLERIAETGRDTRDERDKKFHRGVERDFDEMGLYHNISIVEMYGSANTTVESNPPGSGPHLNQQRSPIRQVACGAGNWDSADNSRSSLDRLLERASTKC